MKANELNKLEENGYYIDWLLNHFMFGYRARPKGDDTLFEINEKWVFADKNTARLYCDKLNEAMVKSGRMQETHLIKDIDVYMYPDGVRKKDISNHLKRFLNH